jgi:transposase
VNESTRFIGVDVSKNALDIAVRPSGTHRRVANDAQGIVELIELVGGPDTLVVLEPTGGYELDLVCEFDRTSNR